MYRDFLGFGLGAILTEELKPLQYFLKERSHINAPPSKNAVSHFTFHANLFSWKSSEEINRQSMLWFPKLKAVSTISNIIQPVTTVVDWPEIGWLMGVSTMFYLQILRFYLVWQRYTLGPSEYEYEIGPVPIIFQTPL